MKSIVKAIIFGVLTWLIPFIVAVPLYSRDGQPVIDIFLFKTIMILVGAVAGAIFLILYFKKVTENYLREGILVGFIWLSINLVLDFVVLIPLAKMDARTYFIQIGLRYLVMVVSSMTVGVLLSLKMRENREVK